MVEAAATLDWVVVKVAEVALMVVDGVVVDLAVAVGMGATRYDHPPSHKSRTTDNRNGCSGD